MIRIKRIYEAKSPDDGYRILVDRLWSRGIKKENAGIDLWEKSIAPSNELRKWYGHDPEKFKEFRERYKGELDDNPGSEKFLKTVRDHESSGTVTLLFGAKDAVHSNAAVLAEWIREK